MKRPIMTAIFALALSTTAAVAQQPAGQQPAAKPTTQQPTAKPTTTTAPAATKTTTKKHKKHSAKTTGAAKMDSTSAKPKN